MEFLRSFPPDWADQVVARKKGKPNWVYEPFRDFSRFSTQSKQLRDVVLQGVHRLTMLPQAAEALLHLEMVSGDEESQAKQRRNLEESRKLAELATSQFESEFALLHGHLLVGLWGAAEAAVVDALYEWLRNMPQALADGDVPSRVRVPLERLVSMSDEERLQFAVSKVLEASPENFEIDRPGMGRFHRCLNAVGINTSAPKEMRDVLYEAQQVRHVFAHRAGIADDAFVRACPSFSAQVGDAIEVNHDRFHRYEGALLSYMVLLLERTFDRYEQLAAAPPDSVDP